MNNAYLCWKCPTFKRQKLWACKDFLPSRLLADSLPQGQAIETGRKAKAKAYTSCSRGEAGTETCHGDVHPARVAEMAFPIAPNPTHPRVCFLSQTCWFHPMNRGSCLQTTLPSRALTSSGDFSKCITYFILPWLVHPLPSLSPSWPFTSSPKASGLFVSLLQGLLLLLSLISSSHLYVLLPVFKKITYLFTANGILSHLYLDQCPRDPSAPKGTCKLHLIPCETARALSQRGCRRWKALVALECAFFPHLFLLTHTALVHDSNLSTCGSDPSPADLLPSSPRQASRDLMFGQGTERNL